MQNGLVDYKHLVSFNKCTVPNIPKDEGRKLGLLLWQNKFITWSWSKSNKISECKYYVIFTHTEYVPFQSIHLGMWYTYPTIRSTTGTHTQIILWQHFSALNPYLSQWKLSAPEIYLERQMSLATKSGLKEGCDTLLPQKIGNKYDICSSCTTVVIIVIMLKESVHLWHSM
jgi:hypothetical protein